MNSDSKKYNWSTKRTLPDGHKLFMDEGDGEWGWALADESGETPDQTDDGVLWLDLTAPLTIILDDSFDPPRESFAIPLVDEDGKQTRSVTNARTMLFLARAFQWDIYDTQGNHKFAVIRAELK
jgi:hypothetical protein